jgi:chemotaxis-related protein WspD
MTRTPLPAAPRACWNSIGVHGDRSCPELAQHVHCHNCPLFADAGRRFLDTPAPAEYLQEWTERLAADVAPPATDLLSVLVFRLADEWLALPVTTLVEVAMPRPVHRVPYRGGLLAGLVNIRGELHLCVHLSKLLGLQTPPVESPAAETPAAVGLRRLLVAQHEAGTYVFPVDAVDRVGRTPLSDRTRPPTTLTRAADHLCSGVFSWEGRAVGLLDATRLFEALRRKLR